MSSATGPLAGIRVVELAGLGPGPLACMVLADMGADVVRIDRGGDGLYPGGARDVVARGRRSIGVDLKQAEGRAVVMDLVASADVLLEGFRPGVTERLGLGPDVCLDRNPRLVYCRMTGWGQDGPLALTAGHDITYLARSGNLARFRRTGEKPVPPANLLGDFGGGSMLAINGILAALVSRATTGRGQVVDTAIVDGVGYLSTFLLGLQRMGVWGAAPGRNLLDTGAPYYEVYACADDDPAAASGRWVAVGALEEKFYAELLRLTDVRALVTDDEWELVRPEKRHDPSGWTAGKAVWARVFATRTRDEWAAVFAGSDACVEPVLLPEEAAADPVAVARGMATDTEDGPVPTPHRDCPSRRWRSPPPPPRRSRTPTPSCATSAAPTSRSPRCGRAARCADGAEGTHGPSDPCGTIVAVRIATWNVNSVKARLPRLVDWLGERRPDVLLMQETKATADSWPAAELEALGYASEHLGGGRWNGVAIASQVGLVDVTRGLAHQPEFEGVTEPRAIGATCGGVRLWSLYVPNGRTVGSPHFAYKLDFLTAVAHQAKAERNALGADFPYALLGDWNVAPHDHDVWDIAAFDGHTHVTPQERAALTRVRHASGDGDELVDLPSRASADPDDTRPPYTFWEMRMLGFQKGRGMRIDLALAGASFAAGVTDVWVDRDARKGQGPSDHAPLVVDVDLAK